MRRLILLGGALLVLAGSSAAYSAELGAITGRVINESTGKPQAGVVVILTSGTEDGSDERTQRVTTDTQGRYEFDDLQTGDERFYALDARFDGGTFAGRAISIPSNTARSPVIETTLRVWNTTTEPGAIVLQRDDLFVVSTDNGAFVIESVTIANLSEGAYIGRGQALGDESSAASVAFSLPDGARSVRIVDSDIDIPALVGFGSDVAATVAFPPGETRVTFSYEIPGGGSTIDLSRPALYATRELSIFAERPLEIRSNRLEPQEPVTLEGTRYARWTSQAELEAGDPLQALAIRNAGLSPAPLIVALGALVLLGVAGAFLLRRRTRTPKSDPRDDLLVAVAELDIAYESGDLSEERWRAERALLRSKLERVGEPR